MMDIVYPYPILAFWLKGIMLIKKEFLLLLMGILIGFFSVTSSCQRSPLRQI